MKEFKHKKYNIQEDFTDSFNDDERDYSETAAKPDNEGWLRQYIPGSNRTYGMFYKIADKLKNLCYAVHGDEWIWEMRGHNLEYAVSDSQNRPFCVDKCDLYYLGFWCGEDENPDFDTLLLYYGEDGDEFDVLSVRPEHHPCEVFTAWDRILKALN